MIFYRRDHKTGVTRFYRQYIYVQFDILPLTISNIIVKRRLYGKHIYTSQSIFL